MMYLLPYLFIFAHFITFCIAEFFPSLISYKQLAMILATISVFIIVREVSRNPIIRLRFFYTSFVLSIICFLFYLTKDTYALYPDYTQKIYNGEFLAVLGQTCPTILVAILFSRKQKMLYHTIRVAPFVSCLFTVIAFFSAMFPSNTTSGGYALDDNGMNYQNISYMSAFASSITFFYLLNYKSIYWNGIFRFKIMYIFMIFTVFVNLFTILLSGGRGGLILIIVQFIMFLFFLARRLKRRYIFMLLPILAIVLIVVFYVVNMVNSVHTDSSGFIRILSFLEKGDDSGRGLIRTIAIKYILESPIVGHGIGSSFFIIGRESVGRHIHSHNFFIDSLLETGVIGGFFFTMVLVLTFCFLFRRSKINDIDYFWLVIFIDGFINSMFSGYYLAHLFLAWSVGYTIGLYNTKTKQRKRQTLTWRKTSFIRTKQGNY